MDWTSLLPVLTGLFKKIDIGGDDPSGAALGLIQALEQLAKSFTVEIIIKSKN
jgi:hypothetical protein